jgi:hypothetical protein
MSRDHGMITILVCGLVASLLTVVALGVLIVRRWAKRQEERHLWNLRQRKLQSVPRPVFIEDIEAWRRNQQMDLDD